MAAHISRDPGRERGQEEGSGERRGYELPQLELTLSIALYHLLLGTSRDCGKKHQVHTVSLLVYRKSLDLAGLSILSIVVRLQSRSSWQHRPLLP